MSSIISNKLPIRKLGLVVGTLALFLSLFLSLGVQTSYAASVEIKDDANVLSSSDESSLKSSAASLPNFTVRFFTTNAYSDKTSFQNGVSSNAPSNGIIYGVSPNLRTSWVVTNGNTGISASERDSIASAGSSSFSSGNYKAGFDAMVSSTRSFASTSSSSSSSSTSRSSSSGGGFPIFGCLIVGIIALVAISVFGAGRRRAMNNSGYNNPGIGPGPGPGYGQNYGPGYGPNYGPGYGQNYGPGYGPGYGNQGGGMGPLGGGIIGAGLGGLAGYELGRQAGHNETGGYNSGFNQGSGGSFGGNESSSGGSGADWGGGGSTGGGADWGSSGSFDAGGGGDWGGGGGDSGGGGGGGGGDSW